jgi:hypothetical protein
MHPHSGPPSQSSMSASTTNPAPSSYAYEAVRRRSLTGGSPSASYRCSAPASTNKAPSRAKLVPAHSHEQPPSSYPRPQMPPPSSPTQQQHAAQPQRPPYASNFGAHRELPGLGPMHRPGSSMSISSIIGGGGDTSAPAHKPQTQPSPPTSAPLPNNHSMQPPSPRRAFPPTSRSESGPFRRQPSPDRTMQGSNAPRVSDSHSFAAGSPPTRSYSSHNSPDTLSQPYKPLGFSSQRLFGPPPSDAPARDTRQPPGSVPPRPNSQPNGPLGPLEQEGKQHYSALGGRRSAYGAPEERRRTLGESHHARPNTAELLRGIGQGVPDRERPVTVHPVSQSVFSPPVEQRSAADSSDPSRNAWRHSAPSDLPREPAANHREELPALYRNFGSYPAPSHGAPRYGAQASEDIARDRIADLSSSRAGEKYNAPPTSDPSSMERLRSEPLSRSFSSGGNAYPGRPLYDQPGRMGEPMQHSKSHIGLGLEESRRTGRASPLPQAVQGAQGQPLSIGKDPGIKSEFGRMFSGLGSGLGSSTPLRGSPLPHNSQEAFPHGQDSGDIPRMQRLGSQQGRKPKRGKDDESVFDNDSTDGRGTPLGLRGAKRNKPNPSHHHYHAPHHQ